MKVDIITTKHCTVTKYFIVSLNFRHDKHVFYRLFWQYSFMTIVYSGNTSTVRTLY